MARRKPGLGKPIDWGKASDDIDAATERRNKGLRDTKISGAKTDAFGDPLLDDDTGLAQVDADLNFYSVAHIAQIANRPDSDANYGQGPAASTRMCSHTFVLDQPLFDVYGAKLGYIFVRFHKNGRKGPNWKYGPVSLEVYKQFANSTSKGTFINSTLNSFPKGPASEDEVSKYMSEFSSNSGTDSAGIRLGR